MITSQSAGAPVARNRRATPILLRNNSHSALNPMRNNKVMMYTIDRIVFILRIGEEDAGVILSNVSWTYPDWTVLNCSLMRCHLRSLNANTLQIIPRNSSKPESTWVVGRAAWWKCSRNTNPTQSETRPPTVSRTKLGRSSRSLTPSAI